MIFQLSDHVFALPLVWAQEIVPMASLTQVPEQPYFLEGFLNLRGTSVPVLRLDRLFKLRELTFGLYTHLIILKNLEYRSALIVDRVSRMIAIPNDQVLPVQKKWTFNECVQGEVRIDDAPVPVLSPKELLLKEESERIRDFQTLSQKRLQQLQGKKHEVS